MRKAARRRARPARIRCTSRACDCSDAKSRSSPRFKDPQSAEASDSRLSPTSAWRLADARFAANFVKIGIHPGFGLTYTLPRLIGVQKASLMFLTGRRIEGKEALALGLCDQLVDPDDLRDAALTLAEEIAEGAPLALLSTRATIREGLADAVKAQTDHEFKEQSWLFKTEDHREGVKAVTERRPGKFLCK